MIGIVHFARNAKPGTLFTFANRGYQVTGAPVPGDGAVTVPCVRMRRGQPAGDAGVRLRFGRDRVSVYDWETAP